MIRRGMDCPARPCLWTLGLLWVTSLTAGAADRSPLRELRSIREVRALTPQEAARGYPVHLRATVTHLDEERFSGMTLHDGDAGAVRHHVGALPGRAAPPPDVHRGDLVEVWGETRRGGFAPNVDSQADPPPRRADGCRRRGRCPSRRCLSGRHDCDYIEISGVAQRAWSVGSPRTMFLDVAVEGGTVRATFWDYAPGDLERFIDARVRLRGSVGTLFTEAGQLRGVSLFVGRVSDVVVEDAAPDPTSLRTRTIESLYQYSPSGEVDRRVRLRGVVTCALPGRPVELTDYSTQTTFKRVDHIVYIRDDDERRSDRDGPGGVPATGRHRRRRRLSGGDAHQTHAAQRDPAQAGRRARTRPCLALAERARAGARCGAGPPHGAAARGGRGTQRARAGGSDRRGCRRGERRRHAAGSRPRCDATGQHRRADRRLRVPVGSSALLPHPAAFGARRGPGEGRPLVDARALARRWRASWPSS